MALYSYKHLKKNDFVSKAWAGGETRELFSFPENSSCEKRNFLFRLSTAFIVDEETVFTSFPSYERYLMLLEGEIVLVHNKERSKKLNSFDLDIFHGNEETKSFGLGRDFNLIVREGLLGDLLKLDLKEEAEEVRIPANFLPGEGEELFLAFYCNSGYGILTGEEETIPLKEEELLLISIKGDKWEDGSIKIMGEGNLILAMVKFSYDNLCELAENLGDRKTKKQRKISFEDYRNALFIVYTGFRGASFLIKKRKELWYDPLIKKAIKKAERFYFIYIVFFLGFFFSLYPSIEWGRDNMAFLLMLTWCLVYLLILAPFWYLIFLPRPVKTHMKEIKSLSDYDKKIYEEELKINPQAEKVLKKYKISGRNYGDEHKNRSYKSFK